MPDPRYKDPNYVNNFYLKLKERGTCVKCRSRPATRGVMCESCAYKNNERTKKRNIFRRKEHREMVFGHYGWECSCCGEKEPLFLEIDHINNDGREDRRGDFYGWIIRNGFPDNLQTLCSNCNQGKRRNGGVCPHKSIA